MKKKFIIFLIILFFCLFGTVSVSSAALLNPGDVYIVDPSAPGEAGLFKLDPSTWQSILISSNGYFSEPMGIAISSDNNILIGDPQYPGGSGSGAIFKVDPVNGTQTILSSGNLFTDPRGIAVATNGDVFVADPDAFNYYGGVIKVDPNTGAQTKIYQSADVNAGPVYLAFEADGSLVVSDVSGTSKGVVRVNPSSGAGSQLAFGGNFIAPQGIAVADNGDIFVADNGNTGSNGKIIKVDPITGAQSVIASGGPINCPTGITFDKDKNLLVNDPCNEPGAIIKVNPTTGLANVVANNFGSVSPSGIVVVSTPDLTPTPTPILTPTPTPTPVADLDNDGVQDLVDACSNPLAPTGLMNYWGFEEGQGTTAEDSFDGQDLTFINSPIYTSDKKIGNYALDFNGYDMDYLIPSTDAGDFGSNDFAISFWIKKAPHTLGAVLSSNINSYVWAWDYPNQYVIYFDPTQSLTLRNSGEGTGCIISTLDTSWNFITFVRNGNSIKGYKNGVESCSLDATGLIYDSAGFGIGRTDGRSTDAYGDPYYLTGKLDEIAIYNRALSIEEIQKHYLNGLNNTGYCSIIEEPTPTLTQAPTSTPTPTLTPTPFPAGYTEVGADVLVTPNSDVTITFSSVTGSGITDVIKGSAGPAIPSQFKLGNPPIYYDINTTAVYNPPIEVCLNYAGVYYQNENSLKLRHFDGANWIDITKPGYPDNINKIICGITDTLSPFVITEPTDETPPQSVSVKIDIKPGSYPNSINPKSKGKIPVAILSSSTFNVLTQIDKNNITFGRTGDEKSLSHCNINGEDVNNDGLLDLVCHFQTQQSDFLTGDTEGKLKGKTVSAIPLTGKDLIKISP